MKQAAEAPPMTLQASDKNVPADTQWLNPCVYPRPLRGQNFVDPQFKRLVPKREQNNVSRQ
jgi:hypothetical protein